MYNILNLSELMSLPTFSHHNVANSIEDNVDYRGEEPAWYIKRGKIKRNRLHHEYWSQGNYRSVPGKRPWALEHNS